MDTWSWVPHCWILYSWLLAGGRESQRLRTSWNHSNTSTLHTKSRGWFTGLRADTDLGRSPRPSLFFYASFVWSCCGPTGSLYCITLTSWQSYAHPNPTLTALAIQEPQLAHGSMPPRQLLPGPVRYEDDCIWPLTSCNLDLFQDSPMSHVASYWPEVMPMFVVKKLPLQ